VFEWVENAVSWWVQFKLTVIFKDL
jgi:hypothetical protein